MTDLNWHIYFLRFSGFKLDVGGVFRPQKEADIDTWSQVKSTQHKRNLCQSTCCGPEQFGCFRNLCKHLCKHGSVGRDRRLFCTPTSSKAQTSSQDKAETIFHHMWNIMYVCPVIHQRPSFSEQNPFDPSAALGQTQKRLFRSATMTCAIKTYAAGFRPR